MPVLLRIALRNLRQHKSKTLIIGTIIALGVIILIVGNSLMDTADYGIKKGFIENFTGEVMVTGVAKGRISLFGVASPGGIEDTPVIPEYDQIRSYLDSRNDIDIVTSQITGIASIRVEGQTDPDKRGYTFLLGVEPESYHRLFDKSTIVDGSFLKNGQSGIVISEENKRKIEEKLGVALHIGDELKLTGFASNRGIKIKSVPIVGIFNFDQFSDGMEMFSYIDVQTIRFLKGMTVGSLSEVELSEEDTAFLDFSDESTATDSENTDILDIDQLFSDDSAFGSVSAGDDIMGDDVYDVLALDESEREAVESARQLDTGAWEYILFKTKQGNPEQIIRELNLWFAEHKIAAQANNWKRAAGPFATSADVVRIIFNIVVLLVVFVAVLIVINTLIISVIERTGEIGTMRALGARRLFVWNLFNTEILAIVVVFGALAILVSLLILGIVTLIRIPATNTLLEVLFAGPYLVPIINVGNILKTFLIAILVGLGANLYPLTVALKIQPVEAMREN
ncbi:MAG: ABC transporter permease [Spirochaetales bacterium]|nr:ABC transporter permease [Spirochaetales bacterium]